MACQCSAWWLDKIIDKVEIHWIGTGLGECSRNMQLEKKRIIVRGFITLRSYLNSEFWYTFLLGSYLPWFDSMTEQVNRLAVLIILVTGYCKRQPCVKQQTIVITMLSVLNQDCAENNVSITIPTYKSCYIGAYLLYGNQPIKHSYLYRSAFEQLNTMVDW